MRLPFRSRTAGLALLAAGYVVLVFAAGSTAHAATEWPARESPARTTANQLPEGAGPGATVAGAVGPAVLMSKSICQMSPRRRHSST